MVVERIAIDVINVPMPASFALNAGARWQKCLSDEDMDSLTLSPKAEVDMQIRASASNESPAFL